MKFTWRGRHLWLAACLLLLTALFLFAGSRASVIVDGTRYHFLDDDQMISMRYARNPADYREHPVPVTFLMDQNALFVHAQSPERDRFSQWDAPVVRYP